MPPIPPSPILPPLPPVAPSPFFSWIYLASVGGIIVMTASGFFELLRVVAFTHNTLIFIPVGIKVLLLIESCVLLYRKRIALYVLPALLLADFFSWGWIYHTGTLLAQLVVSCVCATLAWLYYKKAFGS